MTDIRRTPAYHLGFEEAKDLEPLYADATPEYEAGWKAYWAIRDEFDACIKYKESADAERDILAV